MSVLNVTKFCRTAYNYIVVKISVLISTLILVLYSKRESKIWTRVSSCSLIASASVVYNMSLTQSCTNMFLLNLLRFPLSDRRYVTYCTLIIVCSWSSSDVCRWCERLEVIVGQRKIIWSGPVNEIIKCVLVMALFSHNRTRTRSYRYVYKSEWETNISRSVIGLQQTKYLIVTIRPVYSCSSGKRVEPFKMQTRGIGPILSTLKRTV